MTKVQAAFDARVLDLLRSNFTSVYDQIVDIIQSQNSLLRLSHDCINIIVTMCDRKTLFNLRRTSKFFFDLCTGLLKVDASIQWDLYNHLMAWDLATCKCPRCLCSKFKIPLTSSIDHYVCCNRRWGSDRVFLWSKKKQDYIYKDQHCKTLVTRKRNVTARDTKKFQWDHCKFMRNVGSGQPFIFDGFQSVVSCTCTCCLFDIDIPQNLRQDFCNFRKTCSWDACVMWLVKNLRW